MSGKRARVIPILPARQNSDKMHGTLEFHAPLPLSLDSKTAACRTNRST